MKELKLDLLPGNLYAARRKAEQQKEKEKLTISPKRGSKH